MSGGDNAALLYHVGFAGDHLYWRWHLSDQSYALSQSWVSESIGAVGKARMRSRWRCCAARRREDGPEHSRAVRAEQELITLRRGSPLIRISVSSSSQPQRIGRHMLAVQV